MSRVICALFLFMGLMPAQAVGQAPDVRPHFPDMRIPAGGQGQARKLLPPGAPGPVDVEEIQRLHDPDRLKGELAEMLDAQRMRRSREFAWPSTLGRILGAVVILALLGGLVLLPLFMVAVVADRGRGRRILTKDSPAGGNSSTFRGDKACYAAGLPQAGQRVEETCPTPRVDAIALGADGKGGVWLRERPPWEK
jgi:hypothetical protein